jgi:hypothetical protein
LANEKEKRYLQTTQTFTSCPDGSFAYSIEIHLEKIAIAPDFEETYTLTLL